MEEVLLKNGSTLQRSLVASIMLSLEGLFDKHGVAGALAFYELAEKSKNADYEIDASSLETLNIRGLIDSTGTLHAAIKDVVLSAVEGEGLEMTLGSPVAPRQK